MPPFLSSMNGFTLKKKQPSVMTCNLFPLSAENLLLEANGALGCCLKIFNRKIQPLDWFGILVVQNKSVYFKHIFIVGEGV